MTASASSQDRDEVKRMSNHITRGTLPNPISMSPVALFSPASLCSPESSRPTRFDLLFERNAGIQPSLHYNRAPTSRPVVRSPSPSLVPFCLIPSGDPWPNRAEHELDGLSIECQFSVANHGFSDGDDFANFCSLTA